MSDKNAFERSTVTQSACVLTVLGVFIAFVGWVFEKTGRYFMYGSTSDRGFLTLPLCPIYAISVITIFLLMGTPARLSGLIGSRIRKTGIWKRTVKDSAFLKWAFYFAFVTLLSTAAELVTGLGAKALGVTLWDYSAQRFNLFGVVCLTYSLLWGILLTVFMGVLWTPLHRLFCKIPRRVLYPLTLTLTVPIAVDLTVCLLRALLKG